MKIVVSGATGLVGSALLPFLRVNGHEVNRLVRKKDSTGCCDYYWDPYQEEIDTAALNGVDAVINLSGENIAGRWTAAKRSRIRESRVRSTGFLAATLAQVDNPPKIFVCASAIGYYGHRGDDLLTEESPPGSGFLADVCREWEEAGKAAADAGVRVVNLRIGMVLSRKGGALQKMLLPFKLGLGGIVGDGSQYWSWVTIADLVGTIRHALITDTLHGPVNAVSPNPATNKEFTSALGKALSRPTLLPLPAFAARLALGEMAEALLLSSTRVQPKKLLETNYVFQHVRLEDALRAALQAE